MPYDPSEYGQTPLPHEMDDGGGAGLEAMAARMEASRLAGQMPNTHYMHGGQPPEQVMYAPAPPQRAQSRMMSIDRRLMKAQYYRALMEGNLFDQSDEISSEVEREMKDYIVSRMEALVGEDPATANASKFTDEEVNILKVWAKTLKAKSEQPRPAAVPATPTVRPVAVPTAPVASPAYPTTPAPAGPQVRRKRAPTVRMPGAAEAQPPRPQQAAPQPSAPVPQPPAPRTGGSKKPGKVRAPPGVQGLPMPSGPAMEAVMAQKAMMEAGQASVIETNPEAPSKRR